MLWLMIPAYNEKQNLVKFLPELYIFLQGEVDNYKILIVDDGSTDSTKKIAEYLKGSPPVEVISHEKNKGVGEAFKTGFRAVSEKSSDDDLLIVLEGDGTSDYTLIPDLVKRLRDGSDIVIASRYIKGGAYVNFPLQRHMISLVGNAVLGIAFRKQGIRDYTIFYRGYRIEVIKKALSLYKDRFITSNTFLANTEILLNLAKLTDDISEIPFVYSYDLKMGKSKMPLLRTLFDYLRFIFLNLSRSPQS